MVLVSSSPHLQSLKHLIDNGGDGKGYPVLPAGRERYSQVLVVQFYPKAGIEGMGEHLLPLGLHDLVAGEPSPEHVKDFLRRDPALRAEHQRLRDGLDGERHDDLVRRLDDLPRPDKTDVGDGISHPPRSRRP
jgi:hypothetical protein